MNETSPEVKKPTKWDAIVLTCFNKSWVQTLKKELESRQKKGLIGDDVVLLVVEDPKSEVGSGGATINALLTVIEYISARRGFSVVNPDVLIGSNIFICHTGKTYSYESCSRPFLTLPILRDGGKFDAPVCSLDLILSLVNEKLSVHAPPGVWVCSLDMIISIPETVDLRTSFKDCDVCTMSIPLPPKILKDHGACVLNAEGFIADILFKADQSTLELIARPDGNVPGATGIVYMRHNVAEKLLSFYTKPPLDACTYMGVDSGQPPLKLSLFFDFLLPMTNEVSEEDFVRGKRGGSFGKPVTAMSENSRHDMEYARQILWNDLHDFRIKAYVIEGGGYVYMTDNASEHKRLLLNCPQTDGLGFTWTNDAHSYTGQSANIPDDACLINTKIEGKVTAGAHCAISHCNLHGDITIGKDSLLFGLELLYTKRGKSLNLPDSMVVQGYNIHIKTLGMSRKIYIVHGRHDDLKAATWRSLSSFCNEPWLVVLKRTGILKEDLWGSEVPSDQETIFTAKLFPVFHMHDQVGLKEIMWLMGAENDNENQAILKRWRESWRISLSDVLNHVDIEEEFSWKRKVNYDIIAMKLKKTLMVCGNQGFSSFYNSAHIDGYSHFLLEVLDNIALNTSAPDIVARTLANISDVLGGMAGTKGGLRSGPAANESWQKAFKYLEAQEVTKGILAMAKERGNWIQRPDLLVRAARHYEGAAQILIRQAVMTAKEFFNIGQGTLPRMYKWVEANCPARVDISGGWSDTPPITYEHGGVVTIVGLLMNGKKPIGAKARRIKEPYLKVVLANPGAENINTVVEIRQLCELDDYNQPRSRGALFKAAMVCLSLVDVNSRITLKEQLMDNYGGGFEIHLWSHLPQGSGMGTSSILGGAVLAVILTAAGKTFTTEGLVHMVLCLEQLLTTGGGWQDQVGGMIGGIQVGRSDAELPLKVEMDRLPLTKDIMQKFDERLILIYTGKTRLARNMLQDVVRNWYSRNPFILATENTLVSLASSCAKALQDGDFEAVSKCVNRYWEMKKRMAPGSETAIHTQLVQLLEPFISALCCCGAGGGGFIFGILKDPAHRDTVKRVLAEQEDMDVEVYDSSIDETGIVITVED